MIIQMTLRKAFWKDYLSIIITLDILDIIPDGKKTVPGCIKVSEDAHFKREFNTSEYTGTNGKCNKYKWADKCGVSWDGITYGAKNPCLT